MERLGELFDRGLRAVGHQTGALHHLIDEILARRVQHGRIVTGAAVVEANNYPGRRGPHHIDLIHRAERTSGPAGRRRVHADCGQVAGGRTDA
ncbi:hypothetical protein Adi01nite_18250 [Amorphoplanes digitatis]|nr:hypothetical protein Adi01nite_18250 [Actinoplanes digitatis]